MERLHSAISAVDTVTYVIDAKIGGTAAGAAFTSTNDGYGEALVADDTNTHHDGTAGTVLLVTLLIMQKLVWLYKRNCL